MEGFLITAIVFAAINAYLYYREQQKKEAEDDRFFAELMAKDGKRDIEVKNENNTERNPIRTRDFLLEMLTKIGCQYEIDEKDRINFKWQGGYFGAIAENECAFVVVWYLNWAEYELYDIDTITRVKRAINEVNIDNNINVVYTTNEAGSTFHVHCKKHFILVPEIDAVEEYLQAVLGMFFDARRHVETLVDRFEMEEERTK